MRKNIIHVISGLGRGGAEQALLRLIRTHQFSKEYQHEVVSLTTPGVYGKDLKDIGIVVHALSMNRPYRIPAALFRLFRLLRERKPDIVQTWMVHSDLVGGLVAKVSPVRHVLWGVRTTDYSVEAPVTRAIRWLCARLSYVIPTKIVCAAQASLEASVQAGYDAKKMMVVPNGFDVEVLRKNLGAGKTVRKQLNIGEKEIVIGCLGRYNPAKDHANFVEAAKGIATKYPACRFLMVGRGLENGAAEPNSLINATGVADRFVLAGERSDPAACLDAMDIFVLSSCTEGFPNVLGEAMAMGVPCVTTNVGDAAALLADAGLVVPPRDPEALGSAIAHFLEMTDDDRNGFGMKGFERVAREFSLDATAKAFAGLYDELVVAA